MLELVGVSKSFAGIPALQPTDLLIPQGKTTVLLGSSGCGKSTIVRLMIGLIRTDAGVIRFAGQPITSENARMLRRRMGYVIQEGGLFPHLTARQNSTLVAHHLRRSATDVEKRLAELAALTQLPGDLLDRYPAQLSGGQRQRISLMRALMLDPDVLLLDEPLGALDPIIRSELPADLKRIFQALGKTVVLVTHDLSEAGFFGDAIVLMRSGRIVQQGRLIDLIHKPADSFVTRFINAQRSPLETLGATSS